MGRALYRKYRSKKLSEIVGQEHITKTLENALKSGKISHAYLFTGPRGVGKTSIARILAHEINELPYTDESFHLDIIEIDAASNRRIDEIRDLRDKVHNAPTSAKYKVYIIDEVHMLTREAFNALLKTLEEPPAHVIFILATTELHKLPETIISRTQRFTFKAIDQKEAVKHLRSIAESEGMTIDDDALALLAEHGRGSFRDSISLLDQVGHSGQNITAQDVEKIIGIAANEHIRTLHEHVFSGTPADIVHDLAGLTADGISPAQAASQLSALIRKDIIEGNGSTAHTQLLTELLQVANSPEPAGTLEIALFNVSLSTTSNPTLSQTTHLSVAAPVAAKSQTTPAAHHTKEVSSTSESKPAPVEPPSVTEAAPEAISEETADVQTEKIVGELAEWWQDVLQHIKSINNTLYGVLRMADARINDDTLHLSFGFGFHKKKVADPTTQAKIHEAIQQVTGKSYIINPIHNKNMTKEQQTSVVTSPAAAPASAPTTPASPPQDISSITNIFGGGEVLES